MSTPPDGSADDDGGAGPTLVADQVYEILARQIFDGELAAGARLPVRDLADRVGTSVMPVREAIRLLVKNGLAVTHPHRPKLLSASAATN